MKKSILKIAALALVAIFTLGVFVACDEKQNGGDDMFAIKVGDVIEITFGQRTTKIKVLDVREFTAKADAASMYEVIS